MKGSNAAYGDSFLLLFLAVFIPLRFGDWPLLNRLTIASGFIALAALAFREVRVSSRSHGHSARYRRFFEAGSVKIELWVAWVFLPLIPDPLAAVVGIAAGTGALGIRYRRWRRAQGDCDG